MSQQFETKVTGTHYFKAPKKDMQFANSQVETVVSDIIKRVREEGDAAIRVFSKQFDGVDVGALEITPDEIAKAVNEMDKQTRADTEFAINNVKKFAEHQLKTILPLDVELIPGVHLGHRVIPIERAGCYVPSGRYPLLSAPIMTLVPAKVAGVDEIIACLPPTAHSSMIAVCHLCGADKIFRVGGAQAIAAMAYGTQSIPQVSKIVGPGNAYVNEAKRQVFGPVGIDQLAGPSEIFIIADETACPVMLATDLLAQAEHDVRTRVGLITTSKEIAEKTLEQIHEQLKTLITAEVAGQAWEDYGEIVICDDDQSMITYSDHVAAEHLQVHTRDPHAFGKKLRNYGSLFIGELASVVYSDKCSGTNHTLPTMGAGRYSGGLWVGAYVKIATHQYLDEAGVKAVAPPAIRQSESEGLQGHQRAAQLRLDRLKS